MKSGKYAQAPEPDLILMNMKMPKLDGPEVLNGVSGSEKMPICIVSSTEKKYLEDEIPRHRHFSYLMKPVDQEKLLSCFRSHSHLKPLVEEVGRS
jgi:CheY-like chemotaxis protein